MERDIKGMFGGLVRRFGGSGGKMDGGGLRPILQLNAPVPDFEAMTTHGPIKLSSWAKDRWVILFSHPADFTPVCTTEFMGFAQRHDELKAREVALLASSVDSVYAHIAWIRNIKERFSIEIPFPVIADIDMKIAKLYGMIHEASSDTSPVRALFFIDPGRVLRAMIYYPLNVGRNVDEVVRVIDALQMVDREGLAAPANWRPGEAAIVPPPSTVQAAEERMQGEAAARDWYFCQRELAS